MRTRSIVTVFKTKKLKMKTVSFRADSELLAKLTSLNVDIAQTCRNAMLQAYHEVKGTIKRSS